MGLVASLMQPCRRTPGGEFKLRAALFFCISLGFMWTRDNGVRARWNAKLPAGGEWAGRAVRLSAWLLMAACVAGCNKPAPPPLLLPPPPPETIARLRWIGMERIAADTNAASALGIWNLPESQNLQGVMLDRLALGLLTTNDVLAITNQLAYTGLASPTNSNPAPVSNYQSRLTGLPALLRPLLVDLIRQESFLEVRQATNQPGDLALAIRLNPERARFWETNLAAVLESATGSRVVPAPDRTNGWHLQFSIPGKQLTRHVDFVCAGEWTVLGVGQPTNALASELRYLIQRTGMPFPRQPKDFWLYAEVDLPRVASALSLGWDLPADLPRLTLGVTGDGESVRTRCQFDLAKPLPADLGQWNIPTNVIHDPLVSFTAIRGLGPWLSSQKLWQDVFPGTPPSELYFWAENGLPFLSFAAARLPNASNQVSQLAGRLMQQANPWLATNSQGSFQPTTNGNGVAWKELPLVEPFLESLPSAADDLVFGGIVRDISTNRPPQGLFLQITSPTNLVAYDWELTGTRVGQWLYFGQFFRMFLVRAQLPPKSASVAWINALEFKLGNCGTAVTRTGPAQLSLARKSTMGLNANEIHLLCDWLESPRFPRGVNTMLGTADPPPGHRRSSRHGTGARTNSVPAVNH
jgi:hypothetical protein